MGRLIDADTLKDKMIKYGFHSIDMTVTEFVEDILPTIGVIPKDQYEQRLKENNELINDLEELRTMINKFAESYETRLKADMVAMLEELNLEIDEMFARRIDYTVDKIQDLIQQKINLLKEVKDGRN